MRYWLPLSGPPQNKALTHMHFLPRATSKTTPLTLLSAAELPGWLKKQPARVQTWVEHSGFAGAPGAALQIPAQDGGLERVLVGLGGETTVGLYTLAALPGQLPAQTAGYALDRKMTSEESTRAALGWALGSYDFSVYKTQSKPRKPAALVWPAGADRGAVERTAQAVFLARDLVNMPANDMGPAELAAAARKLAATHGAKFSAIVGEDLLKKNYPAIHAVGKGSPRAPRLVDIRWGKTDAPRVTLVGKGVCFDTGGLDIKPSGAMDLMKKDMGGAAHVLGLAHMIMAADLPVRLRVLIPAVENSTDGNSFRPRDVLNTRKGLTVEVGDTDAEGRLVLCDALAEACTEKPELIIDFATLTGAARVALGPDLPALFCNDDKTAEALLEASRETQDPLWRLPLWQPYADMLRSKVADTNNIGGGGFAGAITAALFMQKFVDSKIPWVHVDTYAWAPSSKPGRPEGGEALGMRAAFRLIEKTFGTKKKRQ